MKATKKTRPRGRPRNVNKPASKTFYFNGDTLGILAGLSEKFRREAPSYISVTDRAVIEALLEYAFREELTFEELFRVASQK